MFTLYIFDCSEDVTSPTAPALPKGPDDAFGGDGPELKPTPEQLGQKAPSLSYIIYLSIYFCFWTFGALPIPFQEG